MSAIQKAVSLVFLALGCQISLGGQDAWKGSIKIENGVTVVKNPAEPIFGGDVLELKEEYVIKASGAYGQYHFQRPFGLSLDSQGRLYVLDNKDDNVKVFDDRGLYLLSIGKKGIGPGELDAPSCMDLFYDEIGIYCSQNRQLSFFGTDGKFKKMLHANYSLSRFQFDSEGNIFAHASIPAEDERPRVALLKLDPRLKQLLNLASDEMPRMIRVLQSGAHFAVTNDNHVIYGHGSIYELKVFDTEGKLVKIILKNHPPVKVPGDEIESLKRRFSKLPPELVSFPKYYSPFYGFWLDEEGRIIVRTRLNMEKDDEGVFDVFSPEGKFLATFRMNDSLHCLWANKRLYAVDEDDDGFPIIRVFRVNWKMGSF